MTEIIRAYVVVTSTLAFLILYLPLLILFLFGLFAGPLLKERYGWFAGITNRYARWTVYLLVGLLLGGIAGTALEMFKDGACHSGVSIACGDLNDI